VSGDPAESILVRLFLAERGAGAAGGDAAFSAFLASLEPEEAAHPLAAWIATKRADLDWNENVCDMLCRHFGLPPKPLWPGEAGNGYEAAASALEARLRAGGRP
jgi:hypothetical protein